MAANNDSHREPGNPEEFATTVTLPPMPAQPRSTRYKILKLQGRGGMGEVWLAHDEHIGRQVAFKRIRTGKEQLHDRFFAEAQVTGQLEHPGIVPVHDLGRDQDNEPYYVMRLIQGRTLKEVIADLHAANKRSEPDEDLRWLRVLEVFVALCRTISFAHSRGVIHRDVKPENVMVGPYGETMVLDWGLCKLSAHPEEMVTGSSLPVKRSSGGYGSSVTQDGEIIGSPLYMSPEMADGRIADEDDRTDVYLLGATLYEVLTNRPPRAGSSQQEIVELARTSPPVAPRKIAPRVPRALEAICLKAMAYRKDERYESAQQVGDEIQRYLAGEPVEAYPEPITQRLWRWARRHRAAIGRGVLLTLALGLAVGSFALWRRDRAISEARLREAEEAREKEAQQAAALKLADDARRDAANFRELAETMHYQLSDTTPVHDQVGVTDPAAADATWEKIQAITNRWGREAPDRWLPEWTKIPDEAERALQREYAELVLWRVQSLKAQPLDSETADALLADLYSIATLKPATYSYQRLLSACLLASGNKANLAEEALALAKRVRNKSAFDYFLEGEEKRTEAVAQSGQEDESPLGRPSPTLLQEAADLYQKAIDLDPQHFWSHLQRGRALLVQRQQVGQAMYEFNLAVALRPESPTAWTARGLAHGVLNNFVAAKHDLDHAIGLKGHSVAALLNRGAIQLLQKNYEDAQADFAAVQQKDPNNLSAAYYLALLHYEQGQFDAALTDCNKVLQRSPKLRPVLLLRVRIDLAQQNAKQAMADLAALSTSGTAADQAASRCALLRRIDVRKAGNPARGLALALAEQEGLKAVNGGLKTAELFNDLGTVQQIFGKFALAKADYDRGLDCLPSPDLQGRLHLKRGEVFYRLKDLDRAKEDYMKAVATEGDHIAAQRIRAEAHAWLGFIAARQSHPELADREAALAMAQLRSFNEWTIWWNLAGVYTALSDIDAGHANDLQEIAMLMLSNCIYQADKTGSKLAAIQIIKADPDLKPLEKRTDYQDLIAPATLP